MRNVRIACLLLAISAVDGSYAQNNANWQDADGAVIRIVDAVLPAPVLGQSMSQAEVISRGTQLLGRTGAQLPQSPSFDQRTSTAAITDQVMRYELYGQRKGDGMWFALDWKVAHPYVMVSDLVAQRADGSDLPMAFDPVDGVTKGFIPVSTAYNLIVNLEEGLAPLVSGDGAEAEDFKAILTAKLPGATNYVDILTLDKRVAEVQTVPRTETVAGSYLWNVAAGAMTGVNTSGATYSIPRVEMLTSPLPIYVVPVPEVLVRRVSPGVDITTMGGVRELGVIDDPDSLEFVASMKEGAPQQFATLLIDPSGGVMSLGYGEIADLAHVRNGSGYEILNMSIAPFVTLDGQYRLVVMAYGPYYSSSPEAITGGRVESNHSVLEPIRVSPGYGWELVGSFQFTWSGTVRINGSVMSK